MALFALPSSADAQTVWELDPYRIRVLLANAPAPGLTDTLLEETAGHVQRRSYAAIGAAWRTQADLAPPEVAQKMRRGLDEMTLDDLPRELLPQYEKITLVLLSPDAGGYRVTLREADVYTRTFLPVVTAHTSDRRMVPEVVFRTLLKAFSPVGKVEEVDKRTVKLRVRAAALHLRDDSIAFFGPGDVFLPKVRYNNSDGSPREVRDTPWTWLYTTETEGSLAVCQSHSGLRSPFSSRRRGRVEQLGLLVHPPNAATRVVVRSQTDEDYPLAGYAIYAYAPDSPKTTLLGHTGRDGGLLVPPGDGLRLLVIKNGAEFLAKLPVVPGIEREAVALVANDDQRLEIEGFVAGVQEQVVDTYAQREVLIGLINARLDEGQGEAAQKLLDRLIALPDRDHFDGRLTARRKRVFTNDPRVRAKIDKMFADTRELLNRFLADRPVEEIASRVASAALGGRSPSGPAPGSGAPSEEPAANGATAPAGSN